MDQVTLLEAGRSCVHEKYRDGRIIKLLWRGLATYIIDNNVDLISQTKNPEGPQELPPISLGSSLILHAEWPRHLSDLRSR